MTAPVFGQSRVCPRCGGPGVVRAAGGRRLSNADAALFHLRTAGLAIADAAGLVLPESPERDARVDELRAELLAGTRPCRSCDGTGLVAA